jgi:hypothetical protein
MRDPDKASRSLTAAGTLAGLAEQVIESSRSQELQKRMEKQIKALDTDLRDSGKETAE